jgi:hypothetical protein
MDAARAWIAAIDADTEQRRLAFAEACSTLARACALAVQARWGEPVEKLPTVAVRLAAGRARVGMDYAQVVVPVEDDAPARLSARLIENWREMLLKSGGYGHSGIAKQSACLDGRDRCSLSAGTDGWTT